MSTRNPFRILKDQVRRAANKAMHVKKMTDPWEIGEFCLHEIDTMLSPRLRRQAYIALIVDLLTNRKEQTDFVTPDFFHDLEYVFTVRRGGKSIAVECGNLDLDDIEQVTKQKENNILAATKERARWQRYCDVIVPLLQKNPKWHWRNACSWIESHGGFPSI